MEESAAQARERLSKWDGKTKVTVEQFIDPGAVAVSA